MTFEAGGFNAFSDKGIRTYAGMQKDGSIIYIGSVADKLAEYEYLEEQNRLIKLPCAVGDTVWFIKSCFSFMSKAKAEKVRKIEIIPGEIIFITENRRFDIGSVGKTVFLTREEAEAALKELERG